MSDPQRKRSSSLQNLVLAMLIVASINVLANIQGIGKEILGPLGKGPVGWLAYALALTGGAFIVLIAIRQASSRFKGASPYARPTFFEIVFYFMIVSVVGVLGYTAGNELEGEWRMRMTANYLAGGKLGDWPQLQGWIGWFVATFMLIGIWGVAVQIISAMSKSSEDG